MTRVEAANPDYLFGSIVKMIRLVHIAFFVLLSSCCAAQPPQIHDFESFDEFADRWNNWVKSLLNDQRSGEELVEVVRQINLFMENEKDSYDLWNVLELAKPGNEYWSSTPKIYNEHRDLFIQLNEIAKRPYLGMPILTGPQEGDLERTPNDLVTDTQLEYAGKVRRATIFLAAHAKYLAYNGKIDQAIDRFESIASLHEGLTEFPAILSYSSAYAITDTMGRSITEILSFKQGMYTDVLTDEQLARFQALIIRVNKYQLEPTIRFSNRVNVETWSARYQNSAYDSEFVSEMRKAAVSTSLAIAQAYPYLQQIPHPKISSTVPLGLPKEQFQRAEAVADALALDLDADPRTQRSTLVRHEFDRQFSGDDVDQYILAFVEAGLWSMMLRAHHAHQYTKVNQLVVIAIHRHRARTGDWPRSLHDLDTDTLPFTPNDYYSGKQLGYQLVNSLPKLWAFGSDRDDDKGRVPKDDQGFLNQRIWFALDEWESMSSDQQALYDGDLVLMSAD
jgi:hypothetical protein